MLKVDELGRHCALDNDRHCELDIMARRSFFSLGHLENPPTEVLLGILLDVDPRAWSALGDRELAKE